MPLYNTHTLESEDIMSRKLNKRQLAYCYWRARDKTIEEAIIKAGYICVGGNARSVGSHLEDNSNIQERIEYERLNIFDRSMITEEYILEGLNKLALSAQNESVRTRAFELLGKYKAMFTDKQLVDATIITKEEQAILNKYIKQ